MRQKKRNKITQVACWAKIQTSSISKLFGRTISFLASRLELLRTQPDEYMDKQRLSSARDEGEVPSPTGPIPSVLEKGEGSGHSTFIFHNCLIVDCLGDSSNDLLFRLLSWQQCRELVCSCATLHHTLCLL